VLTGSPNGQTPERDIFPAAMPGLRDRRLPTLLPSRLLLVEDNEVDVAMVRALLSESSGRSCQVTSVGRLAEARAHLLSAGADCVLLDLSLPDGEGMETVQVVLGTSPEVPIIVLSGLQDDRVTMAALNEGAQDYLVKGQVDGSSLWRSIRYAVERKRAEVALRQQALHDSLTGLANRPLFMDRLRAAIARLARQDRPLAVLVMDLDRFKWVNDSLGHDAGDELLVATSRRIERAVRPTDLVARFGGDEFVVLCEDVDDERNALVVAERVQGALSVDFTLGQTQVRVSASVGIVTSRDPAARAEELLRDADVAMYRAKELGKGGCEPFDTAMRDALQDRLLAEQDLRRGIAAEELLVYYQPLVDLRDGHLVGAEALVRWRRPNGEIMPPGSFIALAEETGLIRSIGDFVTQTACEQLARWDPTVHADRRPPMLHVNLSARQLIDPGLVARIARCLSSVDANPSQLCLELTETAFLVDEATSLERLKALKALGVSLCVDDFGTGYSSLSHLTKFPIDVVKIDKSFTEGLGLRSRDTAVVESVIALGRALGMVVVAEGVETQSQADLLRDLGCPQGQGYLFGKPGIQENLFPAATSDRSFA
jgi:diguanylate cyclase (GGDEF)-like protein